MKKRLTISEFTNRGNKDASIPTFHNKLILFLFHFDKDKEKEMQKKSTKLGIISKPNFSIEALE